MKLLGTSSLWVLVCLIPSIAASQPPDLTYHTVPTCVAVHTAVTGGAFAANEIRTYNVAGDGSFASQGGSSTGCGVPAQVQAVELNVVAYTPTGTGYLKVYPAGQPVDRAMLFYTAGTSIADTGAAAVAQTFGAGDITIQATAPTHVIVKVVGYYTRAVQTVFVHPVPGDHTASGARLINALAGITDASATRRFVVKVEPGIYDVGSTIVAMQPYVDIEGSGRDATVIKGYGGFNLDPVIGVIHGADSAELRHLQVQCDGSSYTFINGIAIYNEAASPTIKDVKIVATKNIHSWGIRNTLGASPVIEDVHIESEASLRAYGIVNNNVTSAPRIERVVIQVSGGANQNHGIANFSAVPALMRDLQITVTGSSGSSTYGITAPLNTASLIRITNATISVSTGSSIQGIHSDGATVEVEQSQVRSSGGGSHGIFSAGTVRVDHSLIAGEGSTVTASTATIGATRLDGGTLSSMSATCAGVYDESFTFYASTCP